MLSAHRTIVGGRAGDIDVNFGSTSRVHPLPRHERPRVTYTDLQLTLRRLGFDRPGQVFWLTTTPEVSDEELALRLGCL